MLKQLKPDKAVILRFSYDETMIGNFNFNNVGVFEKFFFVF